MCSLRLNNDVRNSFQELKAPDLTAETIGKTTGFPCSPQLVSEGNRMEAILGFGAFVCVKLMDIGTHCSLTIAATPRVPPALTPGL